MNNILEFKLYFRLQINLINFMAVTFSLETDKNVDTGTSQQFIIWLLYLFDITKDKFDLRLRTINPNLFSSHVNVIYNRKCFLYHLKLKFK